MEWFIETFLPQFELCEKKRISVKQVQLFQKYFAKLECFCAVKFNFNEDKTELNSIKDFYKYDGKKYCIEEVITKEHKREWYLTIKRG